MELILSNSRNSNPELVYLGAYNSMENTFQAEKWFNIGFSDHPMAVVGWKDDHNILSEFVFQKLFWPLLRLGLSVQEAVDIAWILSPILIIAMFVVGFISAAIGITSPLTWELSMLGFAFMLLAIIFGAEIICNILTGVNFGPRAISNTGENIYIGGFSIF